MKKRDMIWIAALFAAAVISIIYFIPDKNEWCSRLFAGTLRPQVQSAQRSFWNNAWSLRKIVHYEMGNPLKEPAQKQAQKENSLTHTDEDIVLLQQLAQKKAQTTDAAGKVVERTIENMNAQISFGDVKVQNRTDQSIDIEKILNEGANLSIPDKTQPCILIYHSHTHESYVQLDNGTFLEGETTQSADSAQNVVRVGDAVVEELEKAGFCVIHDTEVHDDDYNHAYEHAGETIDAILEQYPSIEVTIDIHRDSIAVEEDNDARTAVVREISGKKAAQIMIITGCEENRITDFPDWYDNLHFALGLQQQFVQEFNGLARPLYFADRKYDMYKTKNSVLIEVGSDGNTLEQAVYSGKMVGYTLAKYLEQYVQ